MNAADEADCLTFLAQKASIKDAAAWVGVSEWDVANLFRPSRRTPRQRAHQIAEAAE